MSNPCVTCSQSVCSWCFSLCGAAVPSLELLSLWNRHSQAAGCWFCVQAVPWCFSQLEMGRISSKWSLSCAPCALEGLPGVAALGEPVQQLLVLCSLAESAQGSCCFNFGQGISSTASVTQEPCPLSCGVWAAQVTG